MAKRPRSHVRVQKKQRHTLSAFTILLIILIALALITVTMGVAGVEGVTPASLADVVTAPVIGFQDAVGVCLFVLVLGGFLGVVGQTGALDAGIAALVRALHGHELALIPVMMFIFSIGGTTYGMCEEAVPFYLLLAATMVAAGFDSLTGAAVVLLGAGCGVIGSTVNPFAVGVAVDSLAGAGIAVNQGEIMAIGVVLWLVTLAICVVFAMRYARRVKANKGSCFLSLQEQQVMQDTWGHAPAALAPTFEIGGEGSPKNGTPTCARASSVQAHNAARSRSTQASNTTRTKSVASDDAAVSATSGVVPAAVPSSAAAPQMTARQKWVLAVFGFTFAIMIIAFIPWADLGIDVFEAGAVFMQYSESVSAQDVSAAYYLATGSTLDLGDDVFALATITQEVVSPWSAFVTGEAFGNWYFNEAAAWFLLMTIVIGFVGGVAESKFVKAFVDGAADMMSVVLVIAAARSITVLMNETGLDVWILDNAAAGLAGLSAVVFAPLSFLLYIVLSFLIPSSSGMATVSMPIMGGLADQLGFSVETMVAIFCAGNGLVNLFSPTCGAIMGGLALAKVEYTTWLKFSIKLMAFLAVTLAIILTAAMVLLS